MLCAQQRHGLLRRAPFAWLDPDMRERGNWGIRHSGWEQHGLEMLPMMLRNHGPDATWFLYGRDAALSTTCLFFTVI